MGFIEAFMEIYNVNAAVAIIFFCGLVLFKMHKADKEILKARLFLNDVIIKQIWIYFSIAGISLALNGLLRFIAMFIAIGDILNTYYLLDLTQIIFMTLFIFAVYSWYFFISGSIQKIEANGAFW